MPSPRSVAVVALLAACASAGASDWLMEESTAPHEDDPLMAEHQRERELHAPATDIRLGGSLLTSPKIEEDIDVPAGGHAHYDWVGANGSGYGIALSAVVPAWTSLHLGGSLALGAEGRYAAFDTTPDSYRVTGTGLVTNTNRGIKLQYQTLGLDLMAGWATTPVRTAIGELHLEVLAVGGGAIAWADTQGFTTGGQPTKRRGAGFEWNLAPRLGIYLGEGHWVLGIHGDWIFSKGQVDIELPAGEKSHIEAMGNGAAGTLEIGYRL